MREYDKNIIFMNVHLHATDAVTHIHEIATGHIRIKWGQTVYEFDYRYLYDPLQIGWFPPPLHELLSVDGNMNFNGLASFRIYRFYTADQPVPPRRGFLSPEKFATYPRYPLWPEGEPQVPLVAEAANIYPQFTYEQKQAAAIKEIELWRVQKRAWLSEIEQYIDLHPDLGKHAGYWLRAADRALQIEFQNPDTDPLIVEKMARLARHGALDIDSVEDFALNINTFIGAYPNGPQNAVLWVTKGAGSINDVVRVNIIDSVQYPAGSLSPTYNPVVSEWVTPNQPGAVLIDDFEPSATDTVTASVTDPDGIIGAASFLWQTETGGTWIGVAGATTAAFTIPAGTTSGTLFRCVATYEDGFAPNQMAVSGAVEVQ